MARIKVNQPPQVEEDWKAKLLREGRMALRIDLERKFHARTPAWRKTHEYGKDALPPGLDLG